MDADRFKRIDEAFSALVDLPSAEREARLKELREDDADLETELRGLLAAADKDESIGVIIDAAQSDVAAQMPAGTRIDAYTIGKLLGRGGMGEVYEAEQTDPVTRPVAFKVVHSHLASSTIVRRFEAERQTLAMMDHDSIAKIFDAGTTAGGRPYFVMELVNGVPIDRYVAGARLGLDDRLRLFLKVYQAIQHAHQKGVIHRDLKPSNILVSEADGSVKVIDFGIAKISTLAPGDPAMQTQLGMTLGTPDYMSPEQADSLGQDTDTRTDVYALGAVLYKVLTGTTPLALKRDEMSSQSQLLEAIRDRKPEPPSRRVLREGTSASGMPLAASRCAKLLRGELDWVVMRALAKSREQRYASASALAADLERYLEDRPVKARPPSRAYQFRKFVPNFLKDTHDCRFRFGLLGHAQLPIRFLDFSRRFGPGRVGCPLKCLSGVLGVVWVSF